MIPRFIAILSFAIVLLAGCTNSVTLYTSPQTSVGERIPSRFGSVEVLNVSLPSYASGEDLLVASTDGSLVSGNALWADDPTREMTLSLARSLLKRSSRQLAARTRSPREKSSTRGVSPKATTPRTPRQPKPSAANAIGLAPKRLPALPTAINVEESRANRAGEKLRRKR